ncbi:hypothetical protein PBAC_01390 [Pedobacter glucosidilyticus]|nr:hypothetical protein [Pedobacter glucosidilyticus]KHJ39628.1 hypothetical protein PBAC_01390 [Pedobacter glucosidilyticus]
MEVREVDSEFWFETALSLGKASVNGHPDFVNVISKVFKVNAVHFIVYKKGTPILGFISYKKGKSLIHPTNYIYTALWHTSSSALVVQEAFLDLICYIKTKYRFMEFSLPPEVVDIRPFIYTGFKADVKYTYINDLNNLKLSSDIKSMRNRGEHLGIEFKWNDQSEDILKQNIDSFFKVGYSNSYINNIHLLIRGLLSKGFLKGISARLDGNLLASGFILVDKYQKNAMNLFITSNKTHYQTGVHSSLYLKNFYFLKDEGVLYNDLFGATTKGIGNFKSNFNGELKPYYYVRYNFLRWEVVRLWNLIKPTLFKLLNK